MNLYSAYTMHILVYTSMSNSGNSSSYSLYILCFFTLDCTICPTLHWIMICYQFILLKHHETVPLYENCEDLK